MKNGTRVVSNGQIISPTRTQVILDIQVRAKPVAVNPAKDSHNTAVPAEGPALVPVIDTKSGNVLQSYLPFNADTGSYGGIAYATRERAFLSVYASGKAGKEEFFSEEKNQKTFVSSLISAGASTAGTLR